MATMLQQLGAATGSLGAAQPGMGTAAADTDKTDQLGQKDFLELMTAQLKNQDPFSPMENGEFLAQMAQFSSVAGLDQINSTLSQISTQLGSNRIATAAQLLDQHVLVPGAMARPDDMGEIHGMADLPFAASAVQITYSDATTGKVLHQQQLGAQPAGLMGFAWDSLPAALKQANTAVQIGITAQRPGTEAPSAEGIDAFVYARVLGVDMPQNSTDLTLRLQDYGQRSSLEISALR